jgi:DNA damage-binding protein 1
VGLSPTTAHCVVLVSGVRGIWSVKTSAMSEYDQYLVITFVGSTHVLAMNANDELDEATVEGFVTDKMTLFCGSVNNNHVVQVCRGNSYRVRRTPLLHVQ